MELVTHDGRHVDETAVATVVDNRGMLCAQGIVRLMRAMLRVAPLGIVEVLSTDPAAQHDYPAWCRTTGHHFLGEARREDERWGALVVSYVQKRAAEPAP